MLDVQKYVVKSTGLVPMKFRLPKNQQEPVRRYRNINPGEVAGVPPEDVEMLIGTGWADIHKTDAK